MPDLPLASFSASCCLPTPAMSSLYPESGSWCKSPRYCISCCQTGLRWSQSVFGPGPAVFTEIMQVPVPLPACTALVLVPIPAPLSANIPCGVPRAKCKFNRWPILTYCTFKILWFLELDPSQDDSSSAVSLLTIS